MGKPIKPEEILDRKGETIPEAMYDAVNAMITLKWNGSSACFRQDDLLKKYFELAKIEYPDRSVTDKLFAEHALDFEDQYRKEGWKVEYDKPAYNESYEPNFTFSFDKE